jgi:hypothetical protein
MHEMQNVKTSRSGNLREKFTHYSEAWDKIPHRRDFTG